MLFTAQMLVYLHSIQTCTLYDYCKSETMLEKNVKVIFLLQGWSFVGTKSKFLGRIWQQREKERKWEKEGRKEKEERGREEEKRRE